MQPETYDRADASSELAPDDQLRTCCDCDREFVLHGGEIRFFERQDLPLPKRCPNCRRANRERRDRRGSSRVSSVWE
jgi:hypothetical protein